MANLANLHPRPAIATVRPHDPLHAHRGMPARPPTGAAALACRAGDRR